MFELNDRVEYVEKLFDPKYPDSFWVGTVVSKNEEKDLFRVRWDETIGKDPIEDEYRGYQLKKI